MEGMIGEVRLFAGTYPPRYWAFCEGQMLTISSHTALFSVIGTKYGGDGISNFQLPDLRGRVAIQQGTGNGLTPRNLGEGGGTGQVVLTTTHIPPHTHMPHALNGSGESSEPVTDGFLAEGAEDVFVPDSDNATLQMGPTAPAGSNQPHENRQPYVVIHYIICLAGVYPKRP